MIKRGELKQLVGLRRQYEDDLTVQAILDRLEDVWFLLEHLDRIKHHDPFGWRDIRIEFRSTPSEPLTAILTADFYVR